MRLRGARTGKRSIVCQGLELTGLMKPFDLEVWYGDRVAVLGSNGSGKSHFLRLLAGGGTDPDRRLGHVTTVGEALARVPHEGRAVLGARVVPGWFAQNHEHPEYRGRTLLDILHRGDANRDGMAREAASSALDRYGLAASAQQVFESLSGGQQARLQILLLELSGATLLLLDEPTDNLDLVSAEALEEGLARFDGTVLAVTHDRWFARGFDRFVVFRADGEVVESDAPVWDEAAWRAPGRQRRGGAGRPAGRRGGSVGLNGDPGDRDRPCQAGPPRLRVRRHRDRAEPAHPRPRRRLGRLVDRRLPVRHPVPRRSDGLGRLAAHGDHDGPARRARRARPRGPLDPLRRPRAGARRDPFAARGRGHGAHAAALLRADQARARHGAHRRDPRRGRRPSPAPSRRSARRSSTRPSSPRASTCSSSAAPRCRPSTSRRIRSR